MQSVQLPGQVLRVAGQVLPDPEDWRSAPWLFSVPRRFFTQNVLNVGIDGMFQDIFRDPGDSLGGHIGVFQNIGFAINVPDPQDVIKGSFSRMPR